MATTTFLVISSVVGAAIAVRSTGNWFDALKSKFQKKAPMQAAAPVLERNEGWVFVHCDDPEAFGEWLGKDEEGLPTRPGEESSLGSHLLIEMFGCKGELLEKENHVGQAMMDAATDSKATIVADSFHEFKPYGVSGAVIIQESHYTIHTWPEHGYAAVDLFYCGGTVLVHRAVETLRDRFQPERIKFLVVRRGVESEVSR